MASNSDDEDLDDVPLSLPASTGAPGGLRQYGLQSNTTRRPSLPLALGGMGGAARPAVIASSFANPQVVEAVATASAAQQEDDDQSCLASRHLFNGGRDMELSFNADAIKSATPERSEEPLPSFRQNHATATPGFRLALPTAHARSPDTAQGSQAPRMHLQLHASGDLGGAGQQQQQQEQRTSSPPHGTSSGSLLSHAHASPHGLTSRLSNSSSSSVAAAAASAIGAATAAGLSTATSGRSSGELHVSVPPLAPPPLPLLRTMKPPRLHLENPATASPVMSPMHNARATGGSMLGRPAAAAHGIVPLPAGVSLTDVLPASARSQFGSGTASISSAAAAASGRVIVSLLSPAFSVPLSALSGLTPPAVAISPGATAGAGAAPTPAPTGTSGRPASAHGGASTPTRSPTQLNGATATATGAVAAAAPPATSPFAPIAAAAAPTPTGAAGQPSLPALIASTLGLQQSSMHCFVMQEVGWEQLATGQLPAAAPSPSQPAPSSSATSPAPTFGQSRSWVTPGAHTSVMTSGSVNHVAVLVEGSSFSLASLEEMLRSNQQLLAAQEVHARTISNLHTDFKSAAAAGQGHAVRAAQLEKDLEYANARAKAAEAEAQLLKAQLQQCDEQRVALRCTLAALRGQFDASRQGWLDAVTTAAGLGIGGGDGDGSGAVAAAGSSSGGGRGGVADGAGQLRGSGQAGSPLGQLSQGLPRGGQGGQTLAGEGLESDLQRMTLVSEVPGTGSGGGGGG